jgi:hypothetical protein
MYSRGVGRQGRVESSSNALLVHVVSFFAGWLTRQRSGPRPAAGQQLAAVLGPAAISPRPAPRGRTDLTLSNIFF